MLEYSPSCAISNVFYLQHILPRTKGLVDMTVGGADNLMEMPEENVVFTDDLGGTV